MRRRTLPLAQLTEPVELRAVTVRAPREGYREVFGPAVFAQNRDSLVIEVQTAAPLDLTPRTSFPVIVLNGQALADTRVSPEAPDRLLGVIPERAALRPENTVEVMWIGNEQATRTRRPISFTLEDVEAERTRKP